jgi:hypothetical protein
MMAHPKDKHPLTLSRAPTGLRPHSDPKHILATPKHIDLRARLPATSPSAEFHNPSAMIGATYPFSPFTDASTALETIPIRRRLFPPGKHQYAMHPSDRGYFSLPTSSYEYSSAPLMKNGGLRCDEMIKLAEAEMERREDEKKYGICSSKDKAKLAKEQEEGWIYKLLWNGLFVGEVLVGGLVMVLVASLTLPFVMLAVMINAGMNAGMAITLHFWDHLDAKGRCFRRVQMRLKLNLGSGA